MPQEFHKIRGRSLDEAYRKLRERFGNEAVVVHTGQVSEGGIFGFFGQQMIEITASVPMRPLRQAQRPPSLPERRYAEQGQIAPAARNDLAQLRDLVRDAQQRMNGNEPAPAAASGASAMLPFPQRKPASADPEALRSELAEIRSMVQVLYSEHPGAGLPPEFAPYYRGLVARGVSRKSAAALLGATLRDSDLDLLRDQRVLFERLHTEIRRCVRCTGGIVLRPGTRRVVALCGPTGVGKTTNLAKLAAHFAVREHARVALITSDTYRVAAAEQLRVYANIVGIPFSMADGPLAMRRAVEAQRDCDLVLIDTAGGSQFNLEQITELKTFLEAAQPDETLLVAGAGVPLDDLRNVAANFKCAGPTALFFSKLDETRQYGVMLSLALETGLPLSYFSTGQGVPEDIRVATPDQLASLILEGKIHRGGSGTATT